MRCLVLSVGQNGRGPAGSRERRSTPCTGGPRWAIGVMKDLSGRPQGGQVIGRTGRARAKSRKASGCGRSETNGRLACIIGKTGCSPLSRIPRDYTASQASTAQHCTTECVRGPLAPSPFKTERARQLVGWTGGLRSPSQDAGDSIEAAGHVQDYSNRGWITKESCSPSASQRVARHPSQPNRQTDIN